MSDIKYTTVDEQVEKLINQNLIINDIDYAKYNLKRFGYSNLIKSYREPYIIRTGDKITYRSGVTFEQILSLYMLDKNMRNAVMAAMQDLEEHIKETAAGVIAKSFGTEQSQYLAYRNYVNKRKSKYRFTLQGILDTLNNTLHTDKNPIGHYQSKYEAVPPWILFKSIYFSTMINFIDLFKVNEQTELVSILYNDTSLSTNALRKLMMDTLYTCLEYRNIAAHGGRIYCHHCSHNVRAEQIFGSLRQNDIKGFSQLLFLLNLFEYQEPYKQLKLSLETELSRHCNRFSDDTTYLGQILNVNIVPTQMSYISPHSNKYHSIPHCSGLNFSKPIDLNEAKRAGYQPCKKCYKQ